MPTRRALGAAALSLLAAPALRAQGAWPNRPVRLLVGFPPGGFTDVVARAIAEQYTAILGQSFVVENRSGASGTIAADAVAKAPADGSVLLLGHSTPNAVSAALFSNLPFDPQKDLTAVAQLAVHPHLLVVPAASPFRTTADLITAAKARPGAISFCSAGIGSVHHTACAMLAQKAGVEFTHVPYRGSGPAMADLIAGRVDMTIEGINTVGPLIEDGKLRPLAAGTLARISRLPNLTTLQEQGYGDIDAQSWVGIFGPAGLPAAIVARLGTASDQAMGAPAFQRILTTGGSIPANRRGADFQAFLALEIERYKAVLGDGKIAL
ncbi:Bug family tripartite tricarboxylate transporter substrate binding protein [Falsiroseomonas selenitidurans]|uniref:Tripartite tricarboxylate transporter substrate binding protein n=1 Tax=Falsiroseomonas selenitidurans TaxID=2716335 RepID=A0ABX1EBE3_9PROT|nr:tripartite tricarboxylate transporter substrate binding protein [Falsiroseomonas selenitidurans]NKC34564.1 tripartite tricarboxylate transporter substrate binding protein [Falsiroseomonas selenitidurans]